MCSGPQFSGGNTGTGAGADGDGEAPSTTGSTGDASTGVVLRVAPSTALEAAHGSSMTAEVLQPRYVLARDNVATTVDALRQTQ